MPSIFPVLYLAVALSSACHAFSSWRRPLHTISSPLHSRTASRVGRLSALFVSQLDRILPIEEQVNGDDNGPQLLQEFMEQKRLREALRRCKIFEGVSPVELEGLVQSCTTLSTSVDDGSNGVLFRQGDKGDAMYIVQSGKIEIAQSKNQQKDVVLATVEPGGLFGELALFFDEARAASARVAGGVNEVRLWKLSKADYMALVTRNTNIQAAAVRTVGRDPTYSRYLERRELMEMMKSQCPIFRGFDKTDLQQCADSMEQVIFRDKEVIIQQGDKGDAMYFVKSGRVICSLGGTGKVLSEIGTGGYFGELALLFDKPRAATVQAFGQNVVLWKLSADKFSAAVQEYPLAEKTLELLQDQYQTKSIFSTLSKSSIGEVTDVIRAASRPKKKNVSTHSVISTMYASMLLSAMYV
jgi:CRP-like cAMP-binding protein